VQQKSERKEEKKKKKKKNAFSSLLWSFRRNSPQRPLSSHGPVKTGANQGETQLLALFSSKIPQNQALSLTRTSKQRDNSSTGPSSLNINAWEREKIKKKRNKRG
jgi:hypothetical protein